MVWDRALLQPVPRRLLRHGRLRALPERQRVRSQHWCSGVSADVLANTESEKNVCENVFNTILQHIYYPFSFLAYITFANHIYIYILEVHQIQSLAWRLCQMTRALDNSSWSSLSPLASVRLRLLLSPKCHHTCIRTLTIEGHMMHSSTI